MKSSSGNSRGLDREISSVTFPRASCQRQEVELGVGGGRGREKGWEGGG